jgi:hypothetical protein
MLDLIPNPQNRSTNSQDFCGFAKGSAVSQVSNLRGAGKLRPPADWEIGDTAGLEACATLR